MLSAQYIGEIFSVHYHEVAGSAYALCTICYLIWKLRLRQEKAY